MFALIFGTMFILSTVSVSAEAAPDLPTDNPTTPTTAETNIAGAPSDSLPPIQYTNPQSAFKESCGEVSKEGLQACIKPTPTKLSPDELRALHASARSTREIIPLPDWCYDYSDYWYFNRKEACAISSNDYIIFEEETGTPVGGMHFVFWYFSFTSESLSNWQSQIEFMPVAGTQWGLAIGSTMEGAASCTGFCTVLYHDFPPQPATDNVIVGGDAQFRTTSTNPSAVGFASTEFRMRFKSPCCSLSSAVASVPPRVRCDNATPGRGVGCVFPDYTPTMVYTDSPQYCCPEVARHIRQAQQSGLPGAYPSGTPLTRLTDPALIDSNGNVACKSSYVRPPGKSCDEYPFRSTWQGARTGGGNPRSFSWCSIPQVPAGSGPAGYSVCMVIASQNSTAGTALGTFYGANRVIDNEPFRVLAN